MNHRSTIQNRKAHHDYFVEDKIECGIVLKGNEIKSITLGNCNINDAWCSIQNSQLIMHNMYIEKYAVANTFDTDPRRDRVLLAHKNEIRKLASIVSRQGYTLAPLDIHWDKQHCKVTVGILKGKKNYDKRNDLKNRAAKMDIDRAIKAHNNHF